MQEMEKEFQSDTEEAPAVSPETPLVTQPEMTPLDENQAEGVVEEEEAALDSHDEEKRQRPKLKTRLNQIQREKFRALDELQKERERNAQLMSMMEMNNQAATYNYENSLLMQLEAAKKRKLEAVESGDPNIIVEADIALNMATNDIQRANAEKARNQVQEQYRQQQYQPPQQPIIPEDNIPVAKEWISNNQWFSGDSDDYDHDLAENVHNYSRQVEQYCIQNGRPDLIYSREYFDEIDAYVNKVTQPQAQKPNGDIRMKQSASAYVAPARQPVRADSPRTRQTRTLTSDEKDLARRLGVKEEDFVKSIVRDKQVQKLKGRV